MEVVAQIAQLLDQGSKVMDEVGSERRTVVLRASERRSACSTRVLASTSTAASFSWGVP